ENAAPTSEWTCYWRDDGTLQALVDVLASGPKGRMEGPLLKALYERLELSEPAPEASPGGGSGAKVEGTDAMEVDVKAEGAEGEGAGVKEEAAAKGEGELGFEWTELPLIGDVVWALRGEDSKQAWFPMKVVEPMDESEGETESDEDQEPEADEGEWHITGSVYVNRKIRLEIPETGRYKSGTKIVTGKIVGWLPAEVSDFVSETTNENAPLWRAKLDDRSLTSQDLEEFEVREAVRAAMKFEAVKAAERAQFLSSTSMFGQSVRFLHGQLMDRDEVECIEIKNAVPYAEFRDSKRVLQHVAIANQYLEERGTAAEREEDLKGGGGGGGGGERER
ncbi:hypothetical protein T484DRAFT_1763618, partial [Baffinella frigidus]